MKTPARKCPDADGPTDSTRPVEAKEGVEIERETQTYATITIQNYFRLYEKLAGMTGTAETETAEFHDIYNLDVLPIPSNRPNQRVDLNDQVFKTRREKYNAVVKKIEDAYTKGQPVRRIRISRVFGNPLAHAQASENRALGTNAKYHRQEAEIVARAGQRGSVTVSTNMAGRGTRHQTRRRSPGFRRPLRSCHRTPRITPYRPTASRPLRTPG